nr:MAG TPA: MAS20 protein import receptor [Caudoviricetes sp.]
MKVGISIGVICCVAAAAYHASCIYRDHKKDADARKKVAKRNKTIQQFFEEKGC